MLKIKVYLNWEINMARITVEDCLKKVNNRFALIHMAAKRVRQLRKGVEPSIVSKNRDVVVSLREIAAGNVGKAEEFEPDTAIEDGAEILTEEPTEEPEGDGLDKEKSEGGED